MTGKSQETIGLAHYLEASARRFPQRPAVVDPDGSVRTYGELDEQSSHLAAFLRSRGIAQGDRVALLMPKSADGVTAIFGILKAGAAYVPVDCTAPSPRVHSILKDCRVRALFTNLNGLKILQEGPAEAVPETVVVIDGGGNTEVGSIGARVVAWEDAVWFVPPNIVPNNDAHAASPTDLAYILYTSGSTGV